MFKAGKSLQWMYLSDLGMTKKMIHDFFYIRIINKKKSCLHTSAHFDVKVIHKQIKFLHIKPSENVKTG